EHQELDRDAEAGGLAGLDQQQAHESWKVEHDAHQASPDARVALWRQDGERESIGSDGLSSIFRHFNSLNELEIGLTGTLTHLYPFATGLLQTKGRPGILLARVLFLCLFSRRGGAGRGRAGTAAAGGRAA